MTYESLKEISVGENRLVNFYIEEVD